MSGPRQQLEHPTLLTIEVHTEAGCEINKGEYGVFITQIVGNVSLDDIFLDLIREAVVEAIYGDNPEIRLPEEGCTEMRLEETGEWEDVFFNRYFRITSHVVLS